jgi:drug/metabolite transporter (DMT)-like permease
MHSMHLTQYAAGVYQDFMVSARIPGLDQRREAAGFLVSVGFVCLAAARDVYLGGLFQRLNPLLIVVVAFSLCTVLFLPAAVVGSRQSLIALRSRPIDLVWVNITSASAWLAFMYALKLIEPSIVQIIYSGIGPLSVIWIESKFSSTGREVPLTRTERLAYLALLATMVFAAAIVLAGLSGVPNQSVRDAAPGVIVAAAGGILISVATMLCRRLNDAGVTPSALLSLRFPATALTAAVVLSLSPAGLPVDFSWVGPLLGIAALLIVAASYVNQVAISLASPLTVRVVFAVGPVLIFFFQMIEGRLSASSYSLIAGILYGFAAMFAAVARQRAIRFKP